MTTTHTIRINSNPLLQNGRNVRATRVSQNRQYGACIVATVTQATVDELAARLANFEAEVTALTPQVKAAQLAAGNVTLQAAEAEHTALVHPWFKALFANENKVRPAQYASLTAAQKERAKAMTIAEGVQDPYATPGNTFIDLTRKLDGAQRQVSRIKEQALVVGQQLVLSWHRDAGLAQKGLAAQDHYRSRHYTLEIRTDIETVSK